LTAVGRLESLGDLPAGTRVLVRGDVDAKPGDAVGKGDIRLRSMEETLRFGIAKGWKQIVFGHRGRDPNESLAKVAKRTGEILGVDVPLLDDWMDDATGKVSDEVARRIESAPNGAVLMLENTRKYGLECVLWKKGPDDLDGMGETLGRLATLANDMALKVADVYVNEGFSAGSMDASSVVIPAAMRRVALGKYIAGEFDGPVTRCLDARLVVFSGIKTDKFDDLEAMMDRGTIRLVIGGGVLGMALKKAEVESAGGTFSLGAAENPAFAKAPYFVPADRIEQAKRIIAAGKKQGIEFALPVDAMVDDGSIVESLEPAQEQFDVGPRTSELFEQKIAAFIRDTQPAAADPPMIAFHNGVFGMFEKEEYAGGTKRFMPQLKVLEDAGVHVYVGGGEGGKALEKYLGADKITHLFTAGGTVLNALGSEPVPYLVALRMASQ
ncbi:MAG: phosphoglycerate kinase, partial [Planctomycetales bacterium]|nr:phosphoglycerate kinase [Planctomycetales bacterium]